MRKLCAVLVLIGLPVVAAGGEPIRVPHWWLELARYPPGLELPAWWYNPRTHATDRMGQYQLASCRKSPSGVYYLEDCVHDL